MTAAIAKVTGDEAYDLIYHEHLARLSKVDQETMQRTLSNSARVWLGYEGDKILCCWGLIAPTILSDRAYLWLYTTEHLRGHEFLFIRYSQRAIEDMLEHYPSIVGNTLSNNHRAIRWLKWLGAEFSEGPAGVLSFEIKADTWRRG